MPRFGSPPGLGSRGDRLRGAPCLKRPVRPVSTPETRQGICPVSRSGPLAGAGVTRAPMLCSGRCADTVARGRSVGGGLAVDLSKDLVSHSSYADRGVEKSCDAGLFVGYRGAHSRMQVRRVPLAIRREPPSGALEVVAQSTPRLCGTARNGACFKNNTRPVGGALDNANSRYTCALVSRGPVSF